MRFLIEKSKYVIVIGVLAALLAALMTFVWGAFKTVMMAGHLYQAMAGTAHGIRVELIALMDVFLIATALYIFAVGLYSLFIGEVTLPTWFQCTNLHDLKVVLSRVIILVMAVTFLEHLVSWQSAAETLMFSGAIAIIMAVLIVYGRPTNEEKKDDAS